MRTSVFSFILCAVAVAGVSVGCNRGAQPGPNPKVTQANVEKITIGMSKQDVEAILGKPWKVEQSDGADEFIKLNDVPVRAIYEWNLGREVDTKAVEIGFKDGKVAAISQTGF